MSNKTHHAIQLLGIMGAISSMYGGEYFSQNIEDFLPLSMMDSDNETKERNQTLKCE